MYTKIDGFLGTSNDTVQSFEGRSGWVFRYSLILKDGSPVGVSVGNLAYIWDQSVWKEVKSIVSSVAGHDHNSRFIRSGRLDVSWLVHPDKMEIENLDVVADERNMIVRSGLMTDDDDLAIWAPTGVLTEVYTFRFHFSESNRSVLSDILQWTEKEQEISKALSLS